MRSSSPAADALAERLAARPWRLLLHGDAPGDWNMAVDAALLATAVAGGPPALRFYGWDPTTVSLGRFQDPTRGIDWTECRRRGWGAVRRPTGGRAVLHQHELTYCIVLSPDLLQGCPLRPSYDVLRSGLADALSHWIHHWSPGETQGGDAWNGSADQRVWSAAPAAAFQLDAVPTPPIERHGAASNWKAAAGAALQSASHPVSRGPARPSDANCFARVAGADIAFDHAKLVGSAQYRTGGALLQHGSILLEVDHDAIRSLFGEVPSTLGLRDLAVHLPPRDSFAHELAPALAAHWGLSLEEGELSRKEGSLAEATRSSYALKP